MSLLPKLESPKFDLVVPSTGKTISFRPYLVKEEKLLYIALESNDPKAIIDAITDVIDVCTFKKLDMGKLTSYDLEYIFLQLRMKSVGESVQVNLKCEKDGEFTPVTVDLSEVKLFRPNGFIENKRIDLGNKISVTLRPITVEALRSMVTEKKEITPMEQLTEKIITCLDTICEGDNVHLVSDVPHSDLKEFVDSLPHKVLDEIQNYLANLPYLTTTVKFTCFKCGHVNTVKLTGIQSFFG